MIPIKARFWDNVDHKESFKRQNIAEALHGDTVDLSEDEADEDGYGEEEEAQDEEAEDEEAEEETEEEEEEEKKGLSQ